MERLLDVHLECDPRQLALVADPLQAIAELSRQTAEQYADAAGARLRHPEPAQVHARSVATYDGRDVLAVATRWVVDAPDSTVDAVPR